LYHYVVLPERESATQSGEDGRVVLNGKKGNLGVKTKHGDARNDSEREVGVERKTRLRHR
jgi:hypothetical protein